MVGPLSISNAAVHIDLASSPFSLDPFPSTNEKSRFQKVASPVAPGQTKKIERTTFEKLRFLYTLERYIIVFELALAIGGRRGAFAL